MSRYALHVRYLTTSATTAVTGSTPHIPIHAPLTSKTLFKIQSLLNESVSTCVIGQRDAPLGEDANAAVLIPLCNVDNQPGILFQVRGKLRTHSGQVSFPGGKIDETDKSAVDAAIRETWEELGIPPQNIHVLNRMKAWQERSLVGLRVFPVVGYISPLQTNNCPSDPIPSLDMSSLSLSVNEVAHVFHLSFSDILASSRIRRSLFRGVQPYYTVDVSDKVPQLAGTDDLDDDNRLEVWGLTSWYLSLFMRAVGAW